MSERPSAEDVAAAAAVRAQGRPGIPHEQVMAAMDALDAAAGASTEEARRILAPHAPVLSAAEAAAADDARS